MGASTAGRGRSGRVTGSSHADPSVSTALTWQAGRAHLRLFKENEALNQRLLADGSLPTLRIAKTFDEAYFSREWVNRFLNGLNPEGFIYELEFRGEYEAHNGFAADENLFSSFNSDDQVPGDFSRVCLNRDPPVDVHGVGR